MTLTDRPYPKAQVSQLLRRRDIDPASLYLLAEVGSTAHGIDISGSEDFDATAVRMESFSELINGPLSRQSLFIRTQPEGIPSRLGDVDLNVYTLRKFAGLAQKGNPSILAAIFSPYRYVDKLDFEELAGKVASKRAAASFLGYMRQQIERWEGTRGQKSVHRADLVEKFGFDTKYAAHIIRLGFQGIEYLTTGRFTMPMSSDEADLILSVRTGEWSEGAAKGFAYTVEAQLKLALESSPLPDQPARLESWLCRHYAKAFPSLSDGVC
jgi:hypothetical protein